jgi:hypothetical protein
VVRIHPSAPYTKNPTACSGVFSYTAHDEA